MRSQQRLCDAAASQTGAGAFELHQCQQRCLRDGDKRSLRVVQLPIRRANLPTAHFLPTFPCGYSGADLHRPTFTLLQHILYLLIL